MADPPPSYRVTLSCTRAEADAAVRAELADNDGAAPSLVAAETADGWELHLYVEGPPSPDMLAALAALAPSSGRAPQVAPLPETDWVTLSQAGLAPVDIGRFHVHTHEHRGHARPGQWPVRIDAGLAFGTGRHATTAGCIAAATRLARRRRARNILDVGTGSGLLVFAARRLHPAARLTAADVDPVAVAVAAANARLNGVSGGALRLAVANGVAHRMIARRGPYDLVFANILAGPLVALAPSLSSVVAKGGTLILAGLLQSQAPRVLAAYRARGLVPAAPVAPAEWPVLVLERRRPAGRAAPLRALRPPRSSGRRPGSASEW